MSNIDKRELREELSNPAIGSNAHLRKLALALLDELEANDRCVAEQAGVIAKQEKWIKDVETTMIAATDRAEAAEKRIAELEALEAKTVWSDIDMSDADCFTITRLQEIIYASELKWPEAKLLARFMHDVKQQKDAAQ